MMERQNEQQSKRTVQSPCSLQRLSFGMNNMLFFSVAMRFYQQKGMILGTQSTNQEGKNLGKSANLRDFNRFFRDFTVEGLQGISVFLRGTQPGG